MLAGAGDLTYVRVHNASSLALPEKIATAVAEFIAGPLVDNPYRVGHPIHDEYAGQYSAPRAGVAYPLPDRRADPYRGRTRRIPPFGHLRHMIHIAGNGDLHAPPAHWSYATLSPADRRRSRLEPGAEVAGAAERKCGLPSRPAH